MDRLTSHCPALSHGAAVRPGGLEQYEAAPSLPLGVRASRQCMETSARLIGCGAASMGGGNSEACTNSHGWRSRLLVGSVTPRPG